MGRRHNHKTVRGILDPILEQLVDRGSFTSFDVQERALRDCNTLLVASVDREKRKWLAKHGYPATYNHRNRQYETAPSEHWKQGGLFDQ